MSAGTIVGLRRRRRWWGWCAAAILFCVAVGVWQASLILQFRRPGVDQVVPAGQHVVFDGVRYELTKLRHAPDLPMNETMRSLRDTDLVSAIGGAELVLVVLAVEIEDSARDPKAVFCDVTLRDRSGRTWRTDGNVEYLVQRPEAVTCSQYEDRPRIGVPFEVGLVYQVPAEVADEVTVRARLSGGADRQLVEFQPR